MEITRADTECKTRYLWNYFQNKKKKQKRTWRFETRELLLLQKREKNNNKNFIYKNGSEFNFEVEIPFPPLYKWKKNQKKIKTHKQRNNQPTFKGKIQILEYPTLTHTNDKRNWNKTHKTSLKNSKLSFNPPKISIIRFLIFRCHNTQ